MNLHEEELAGNLYTFDTARSMNAIPAYKRRTFALLDPRPGDQILDVGCDSGDDARTIAKLVGGGRVVGVDLSAEVIADAQRRSERSGLPVEFHVADAHRLEFPDASFDACRSDRTFQHLKDTRQALRELIRVTRPGGRIVVSDPDWGTLIVDAADREVTRRLLNFRCDTFANGWMGRRLPTLFSECGLQDIVIVPHTLALTDFALADYSFFLRKTVVGARAAGVVTALEATTWLKAVEQASREGRFFGAVTGFIVRGRRPG